MKKCLGVLSLLLFLVASTVYGQIEFTGEAIYTDSSGVIFSPLSIDPGHKHSKRWSSDGSPLAVSTDQVGNTFYGSVDISTSASLSATVTAIGATAGVLELAPISQVGTGITFPVTLTLKRAAGAILSGTPAINSTIVFDGSQAFTDTPTFGNQDVPLMSSWFDDGDTTGATVWATNKFPCWVKADHSTIAYRGDVGIGTTTPIFKNDVNGGIYSRLRHGKVMFDNAAAGTQIATLAETVTNGLYTLGGTNYAAANATIRAGGAQITTAAADDDSAFILVNMPVLNTSQNPRMSFRFKVDNVTGAYVAVGLTTASFVDKATLPDNCALIGIDADNGHTFGAARLILTTKDDAAAVDYDDLGSNMANNTWVWGVLDLVDPDQPRVWIAGTEIAAASITGTVKDATNFYLYFHVQNLAVGAHTLTVVCDHWQQDQP